jgi:hypothetical protein
MEKVAFQYGDSRLPDSPTAGGSCQTVSIVAAVHAAVEAVHRKLLTVASADDTSPLAHATFDQVEARVGGLFRTDDPNRGTTYSSILQRAGQEYAGRLAVVRWPWQVSGMGMPAPTANAGSLTSCARWCGMCRAAIWRGWTSGDPLLAPGWPLLPGRGRGAGAGSDPGPAYGESRAGHCAARTHVEGIDDPRSDNPGLPTGPMTGAGGVREGREKDPLIARTIIKHDLDVGLNEADSADDLRTRRQRDRSPRLRLSPRRS